MLAGDVLGRTGQETRPTGAGEDDLLAGGRSGVR